MKMWMEDYEGGHLAPPSPACLFPGVNSLWWMPIPSPVLGLCCHDLGEAEGDAGCQTLCSTCCTSLCIPSPTVDIFLSPNDHDSQDYVPLAHMPSTREEGAFFHQGCGSGSRQGSGIAIEICRVWELRQDPSLLLDRAEESVASQNGGRCKTWNVIGTSTLNVRSCARYVWNKGNGDRNGHVIESGIDWEKESKTWIGF